MQASAVVDTERRLRFISVVAKLLDKNDFFVLKGEGNSKEGRRARKVEKSHFLTIEKLLLKHIDALLKGLDFVVAAALREGRSTDQRKDKHTEKHA